MSDISRFFKRNKAAKSNTFYAATKSLCDESGEPLKWEIKPVSSKENEEIQESCMYEVQIPGKPGQFRQKIKMSAYIRKLVAASVVFPELRNAELQDSYGVTTEEELVQEMVDDSGEWNNFIQFINNFNGFVPLQEDVETAKN
jgi:hypothetical protein